MKEGKRKEVKFNELQSPRLVLNPKHKSQYETICNCGTAALSIMTGLSVNYLQKLCKNRSYWYIEDMLKLLRKRKYKVVEVTRKNVLYNREWYHDRVNSQHCVLMFLKMDEKEYSAFVMHRNVTWHNFRQEVVDSLYMLNRPIEEVYIIHHPKWK